MQTYKSARTIRKEFLDFFTKDLKHTFIKSSPIVPLCDPTVAFVNSGMNQFKGVFLGYHDPPALRVVNSQKCIRIGGKHNDFDVVGSDSYHHTFFEMLGNWSFGDYFKESACEFAWKLLTGPYGIKKDYLYVTYFAGNEKLGLKPDLECKEIWLQLGVPKDRVLPFEMQDNFWEMGPTGPCGPCTEIHVDITMQAKNQASRVNKGYADLLELWNIVFIEYQRLSEDSIIPLSKKHIDTGMGFERLVAVLQEKRSNYDTDLFQPLFEAIQKKSNAPKYQGRFTVADKDGVDSGYRILADHARMISVALADGMLPDHNHKLRRVLRRAIDIGEKVFKKSGILYELTFHVADNLGDTYPELQRNLKQVQKIIEFEEEILKSLRDTADKEWKKLIKVRPALATINDFTAPGLIAAYKDLQSTLANLPKTITTLPADLAFKLYDTYGLNPNVITELAKVESLSFDKVAFDREFENTRQRTKFIVGKSEMHIISPASLDLLEKNEVPKTDDSLKYNYIPETNGYRFPKVVCKLVGLIVNGNLISQAQSQTIDDCEAVLEATVTRSGNIVDVDSLIDTNSNIGIILDKTPFYTTEGGQMSDIGHIKIKNLLFNVREVKKFRGYVVHIGKFVVQDTTKPELELRMQEECIPSVDVKTRMGLMQHHTATHLLNAALKKVLSLTNQQSSTVTNDSLSFQFSVFGEKFNAEQVGMIEGFVNRCIEADVPVKIKTVDFIQLLKEENLTLISGENYPDTGIRIVEVHSNDLTSKEACCGTHVHSTGTLKHFCILKLKSRGTGTREIKAVVGPLALSSKLAGENIRREILQLEKDLQTTNVQYKSLIAKIHDVRCKLMYKSEKILPPYTVAQECLTKLDNLLKLLTIREREVTMHSIEAEMRSVVHSSTSPFIVHCFQPSEAPLENVALENITKLCPIMPVLIIAYNKRTVTAQCCVPEEMVSDEFNAQAWMKILLRVFNVRGSSLKDQNPLLIYNMKFRRESNSRLDFKSLVEKAIIEATNFASLHINKTKHKNE